MFLLLVELAQEVAQLCWLDCKLECATFYVIPNIQSALVFPFYLSLPVNLYRVRTLLMEYTG